MRRGNLRRSSEETQKRIIRKASELFFRKGYDGTSFEDIAKACKINKGTIYYFFRAKDKILYEVCIEGINRIWDQTLATANSNLSPEDKLRKLVIDQMAFQLRNKGYSGVGAIENRNLPAALQKQYISMRDKYESVFRQVMQDGIDQGQFAPTDVNQTTRFILGLLISTIRWHRLNGALTVEEIANQAANFIMNGMLSRNGSLENHDQPAAIDCATSEVGAATR